MRQRAFRFPLRSRLRRKAAAALLGAASACAAGTVSIKADRPFYAMREGFGANIPAIQHGIAHEQFNSGMGSEYCEQPNPGDQARWGKLTGMASWSGLDWIRVYFEFNDFEPQKDVFTWDSENFLTLLRWLDWAQANEVDVLLQEQDVASTWNCMPGTDCGFSAPNDLDAWARGYATLVDRLVNKMGYTCIKMLNVINEPNPSWGWWRGRAICEGYRAARTLLDAKGIRIPFVGTEAGDFEKCSDLLWANESHEYNTCQKNPAVPAPRTMADRKWASLWGEWGLGGGKDHDFDANIRTAKWMLAGLYNKNDGYARWSYLNMNDIDGEFSYILMWDPRRNLRLDTLRPQRNLYWNDAMISRFTAKYSALYGATTDNPALTVIQMKSPNGNTTIEAVNGDTQKDAPTDFSFVGLAKDMTLFRYASTPATVKDKDVVRIAHTRAISVGPARPGFTDTLAANSITVYSTFDLGPDDPGIIWDGDYRSIDDPEPSSPQPVPARPAPDHPAYPADFDSAGTWYLANRATGKLLQDGPALADSNGTRAQRWRIHNLGHGYYAIRNEGSGKALDNLGTKEDGKAVGLAEPAPGSENQMWQIIRVGNGYFKLRARGSLRILSGGQSKNRMMSVLADAGGVAKQAYEANSAPQNWRLIAADKASRIVARRAKAGKARAGDLLTLDGRRVRKPDAAERARPWAAGSLPGKAR